MENKELTIIQGDTFSLSIQFENVDYATIDKVYFTSKELGISDVFTLNNNKFQVEFNTDNLPSINTTYDITVVFKDEKVRTVEYRGKIKVLKKVNSIT